MSKFIIGLIVIVLIIIGVVVISDTEKKPKVSNPTFEISPYTATVTEGVDAKFTISIPKAPYSFDPKFEIAPVRSEDSKVLVIDDHQLKQIGHLDVNNTASKEISIRGQVVYGDFSSYSIKVKLMDNDSVMKERTIYLNVTR